MDNKVRYEFDQSTGILYKYYYGPVTIEDISTSWEYAFEHHVIPAEVRGFILDYRKATFSFKPLEHVEIADFYKKHLDVFGNFKIAIITDNPRDVIIPIMVESKDDGYFSMPFSSTEAAIAWVLK